MPPARPVVTGSRSSAARASAYWRERGHDAHNGHVRRAFLAAVLVLAAACGGEPVAAPTQTSASPTPPAPASPTPEPDPEPEPTGTRAVTAQGPALRVFEQPGPGAVLAQEIPAENDWGQRIALPVVGGFEDEEGTEWLRVMLPDRPNGSQGWLRGDEVRSREVASRIVVDLSDHSLTRFQDGQRVSRFSVGVGVPAYPTTSGRFFVWARVPYDPPTGAYGVFALGLSAFSDVITDWVGGGRMAIHGTTNPTDRGRDVSHGCVRVYNPQMEELMDVPLGTPVVIRP